MSETRKLLVRDLNTREVVREIPVTADTTRNLERVMAGLLMNMDTDRYFVDDSAFDDLYRAVPPTEEA